MARSAKMSRGALLKLRLMKQRSRIVSISTSVLVILIVTLMLWLTNIMLKGEVPASFIAYVSDDPPQTNNDAPMQKDLTGGTRASVPPVSITVAVDASATSLPAVDTTAISETLAGVEDATDGLLDMGGFSSNLSSSFDDGISGGGSGMGNRQGGGSSFCGRFWDLKKTKNGADSHLKGMEGNGEVMMIASRFYNGNWDTNQFKGFFESDVKLYASCFYMPFSLDTEATNAYDPDGTMGLKPSHWIALYSAWVQAPVSGRFRFVGIGDSIMGVRFNGKNVLQCGFHTLTTGQWNGNLEPSFTDGKEFFAYEACDVWNQMFGGFVAGDYFEVKAGEWYQMDVLISEIGGGAFGFCLLLDEEAATKETTEDGKPIFQLFRTAFVAPTKEESYAKMKYPVEESNGVVTVDPPYDEDSLVWIARPNEGGTRKPSASAGRSDSGSSQDRRKRKRTK